MAEVTTQAPGASDILPQPVRLRDRVVQDTEDTLVRADEHGQAGVQIADDDVLRVGGRPLRERVEALLRLGQLAELSLDLGPEFPEVAGE